MNKPISFVATGDSFITRRVPPNDKAFEDVSNLVKSAEVRFTNLEITTHRFEGIPGAVSGGTWAIAPPEVLEDLKEYGFNMIGWANNHTLDYLHGGLEATEKYLNQFGFVHAGAGGNLSRASEPKYLETSSGRVALIAATASFHETWIAGDQRPDMVGRPGINPLRYRTLHKITAEKMSHLKEIADTVDINAVRNLSIKEGFVVEPNDNTFTFGNYLFIEDEEEGQSTTPHDQDMERILRTISEAKRQSDYVIVSIHSHEMNGKSKEEPADFLKEFARRCIDEGAHAIIGHGPHILRGIEIYKSRPIFYSLGNFIFQNETVALLPADFYTKYGLSHGNNVADAYDSRSKNNTIGFGENPDIWLSVVPHWRMYEGELTEITLYPIELGYSKSRYSRGWPSISDNPSIIRKLQELSEPFGTRIHLDGAIGRIYAKDLLTP